MIGVELGNRVHRVANFAGIGKAADPAHDNVKQTFYRFGTFDAVALDDVLKVGKGDSSCRTAGFR